MAGLDYLFQGSPPPAITTTASSSSNLPDWYQEYIRGMAAKGTDIAGQQSGAPLPAMSVAGFTPDQQQAFQGVRQNQGVWQPGMTQAQGTAGQIVPQVTGMVGQAQQAVAGPAAQFPQNFNQYMSPYTQQVTDEIARLGNRNFQENIMPGVNSSMIGNGQFGSTRNADILSRAARDSQANISGLQSQALQSGYGTAADIFSADANRQQQQQQMQGSAALTGAATTGTAMTNAASQQGALAQARSALGLADAQALGAVGQEQQGLQQLGLDTNYANAMNAQNFDWTQLNNLNSIVRGVQLPGTQVDARNGPSAVYQPGALQTVGSTYGWARGNSNPGT